jgi:Cell division protein FtsI/penicillin-binding protein 2
MKINANRDPKKSAFHILYIFLGLIILMMGYFTYFIIFRSNEVINNSYNKRQAILSERVVRGEILSADGEVLAKTSVDENGKETREYPFGEVFAHIVGRCSKGKTGIEEAEDIRLLTSNLNAFEIMYNDLIARKSLGDNVVTTLNAKLQKIAYDALGNYRGAVVVMEPSTGKILAMVSKPSYDPNKVDKMWEELLADEESQSPLINRATQGLYPPGSTFKILTSLEYIRENPTSYTKYHYRCNGSIQYEEMTIHCHNNKVHGNLDLPRSFAKSCNTSYANIGKSLNMDSFNTLCNDLLFNSSLPFEMESNPSQFTLKKGTSGVKELMQTAIGQGNTLITPLHNAMITSAIANGGIMIKPYVVERIENADKGTVKKFSPKIISKPMTAKEASYIGKMMRLVVTDGTGTKLEDMKQKAAGKTGSADNSNGKAHAWFVGYAPLEAPEIVVSVIVENVGTGSDYAVPIAKQIFSAYFQQ